MIPVVWKSYHDSPGRGYWDQQILEWLFQGFEHYETFPDTDGIIFVTPGHWRTAEQVNTDLQRYDWVLVVVTSDEEGECPYWDINHPNMILWRSYPRPNYTHQPDRYLPLGWTPGTLEANREPPVKTVDWLFAGQVRCQRRRQAVTAMKSHLTFRIPGVLYETPGFTQGWDRDEYFEQTRKARIVMCPSGPWHPDSFRMYEALESGCIPIGDIKSVSRLPYRDRGVVDPWEKMFHTPPPFPFVDKWKEIKTFVPELLADWPASQHRVAVWWQQEKRALKNNLRTDLGALR